MARHRQVVDGRLHAEHIVQHAEARARTVGAELAARGQQHQPLARVLRLAMQRGDGLLHGPDLGLGLVLQAVDGAQRADVAVDIGHLVLVADAQVQHGGEARQLLVLGLGAAAHDDEVGRQRLDGLVVGLEQAADACVFRIGIAGQQRRHLELGHSPHLAAQRLQRVQRRQLEHQHAHGLEGHLDLALGVRHGHGLADRCRLRMGHGQCQRQRDQHARALAHRRQDVAPGMICIQGVHSFNDCCIARKFKHWPWRPQGSAGVLSGVRSQAGRPWAKRPGLSRATRPQASDPCHCR